MRHALVEQSIVEVFLVEAIHLVVGEREMPERRVLLVDHDPACCSRSDIAVRDLSNEEGISVRALATDVDHCESAIRNVEHDERCQRHVRLNACKQTMLTIQQISCLAEHESRASDRPPLCLHRVNIFRDLWLRRFAVRSIQIVDDVLCKRRRDRVDTRNVRRRTCDQITQDFDLIFQVHRRRKKPHWLDRRDSRSRNDSLPYFPRRDLADPARIDPKMGSDVMVFMPLGEQAFGLRDLHICQHFTLLKTGFRPALRPVFAVLSAISLYQTLPRPSDARLTYPQAANLFVNAGIDRFWVGF